MQIQGKVGPAAAMKSLADGSSNIDVRLGNMQDVIMSELHGRYYENAYRRNLYSGGNTTGMVTTVGTAAINTGLCLTNPIGNTFNLVLLKAGFALTVAQPAAAAIGLMTSYSAATAVTQTTPLVPANNFVGLGQAPTGLLASSVTAPNAFTLRKILAAAGTAAITAVALQALTFFDCEGSIILPPGACVAFYTSSVTGAASFFGSFTWEEVPV